VVETDEGQSTRGFLLERISSLRAVVLRLHTGTARKLPHSLCWGLVGGLHHDHPRDEFARSFSHPGGEVLPHELIQWRATLGTSEAKLSRTGCGGTAAPSRSKQPWQCNLQHDTRAHTGTLRHTADRSELAAQTWLVRCRYFVLSNRKLSYYENETMSRLLGTVELEVRCTLPVLKTLLRRPLSCVN
jgi:hypothetical protein